MTEDTGPHAGGSATVHYEYYAIDEVLNYGGFFGGTTVTIYAHPPDRPKDDRKFIISEHNFENLVNGDRFKVLEGLVLGLVLDGEEVRSARVAAAPARALLRSAAAPPPAPGAGGAPRCLAYHCASCDLWVAAPAAEAGGPCRCEICSRPLAGRAQAEGSTTDNHG